MPPPEATGGRRKGIGMALVIVIAVVTFLAGLGIGYVVFTPPTKLKLIVGTNAPFPPYESYNDTTGQFEGFDIAIAQLVANALGRDMVVRNFNNFDLLLETVGTGGVDIAVSAITMSGTKGADRNRTMDFSEPYYSANQAVVIRSSDTFTCANNLCNQSTVLHNTIGVQGGTTSESWVDTYITGNQTEQIFRYQDVVDEINALKGSVYRLMIIDEAPARAIAAGSGGALKVAGIIVTNELYGVAVANNDPKGFVAVINSVLDQIKADGRYNELITKWFGG